jgi:hypothetical protein
MKIPKGIDVYYKRKRMKAGQQCPAELEGDLKKAIEAREARLKSVKAKPKKEKEK